MGLNGKRLKSLYRGYKERRHKEKSQAREIEAIRKKAYFEASKEQAKKIGKAQATRKKIGFAKALGFAHTRGVAARQGIAASVGVRRNGSVVKRAGIKTSKRSKAPSKIRYGGKVYTLKPLKKRKKVRTQNLYDNYGGMGFG